MNSRDSIFLCRDRATEIEDESGEIVIVQGRTWLFSDKPQWDNDSGTWEHGGENVEAHEIDTTIIPMYNGECAELVPATIKVER